MRLFHQSWIVSAVRIALLAALVGALIEAQWSVAFVALATLTLSTVPELVGRRLGVHLPVSMIAVISLFLFATLFLGEVLDFYNRYWWWDVALHGGSALGFGLMGVVFALFLFEGESDEPVYCSNLDIASLRDALAVALIMHIPSAHISKSS